MGGGGASGFGLIRRKLSALLVIIALASLGVQCSAPKQPYDLATSYWPGYEPLYLARELGYLDPNLVRLREMPSTTESLAAFRSGRIDIAALTLDEALLLEHDGIDVRIVLVMDTSFGGDAVMARPEIKSLAELKGKRVGVESGALGAYVLSRALDQVGLTPADVTVVPVPSDRHFEAYASGEVDAVVTFEPTITRLLARGAREVFDSTQIPNEIIDVIVMRESAFEKSPETVANLEGSWYKALDYYNKHPEDAVRRMAMREKVTPQAFAESLEKVPLTSKSENDRLLRGNNPAILKPARMLDDVMLKAGILTTSVDPRTLLGPDKPGGK